MIILFYCRIRKEKAPSEENINRLVDEIIKAKSILTLSSGEIARRNMMSNCTKQGLG